MSPGERERQTRLAPGTRVLVTGASGFLASHLLARLIRVDCTILAQSRPQFNRGLRPLLGSLELLEGGWDEPSTGEKAAAFAPQVVFHLSGRTDQTHSRENDARQFADHLQTALAVVRAVFRPGLERLVFTATNEEYGASPVPHAENQREQPISAYSAAKTAVTHYLQMLWRSEGLPVIVVRPFLVYGPGQARGLVPAVARRAFAGEAFDTTEGSQTRDLVFVSDVIDGLLRAATVPGVEGSIFNLGTGVETPVRTVVERIVALAGGGTPRFGGLPGRPGEMQHSRAALEKSRRELGWKARVSLEEGLGITLEAMRPPLAGGGRPEGQRPERRT
ncbi:MAG: NAD-dependent epimerase/dehydratase family protein, partial [Planctomycetota bacterium]